LSRSQRAAEVLRPDGGRVARVDGSSSGFLGRAVPTPAGSGAGSAARTARGSASGSQSASVESWSSLVEAGRKVVRGLRIASTTKPTTTPTRTARPPHRPSTPPARDPTPHPMSPPPSPDSLSAKPKSAANAMAPMMAKRAISRATIRSQGTAQGIPRRRRPRATAMTSIVRGTRGENQPNQRRRASTQASTTAPRVRPSIPRIVIREIAPRTRAAASSPCSRTQPARSHPSPVRSRAGRRTPRSPCETEPCSPCSPSAEAAGIRNTDAWSAQAVSAATSLERASATSQSSDQLPMRRLGADDTHPQAVALLRIWGQWARSSASSSEM
jgi:hypothetical protein